MSRFLIELAVVSVIVLLVMAVKFRSARAREVLRFAVRVAWIYIAVIMVLAVVQLTLR